MSTTVILINSRRQAMTGLRASLEEAGFQVLAVADDDDDLITLVERYAPDAIVIDAESPARDTLEGLAALHQRHPRPMIMLSDEAEQQHLIREAANAGVSVYVAEGVTPRTMRSLVDTAIVNFDGQQRLHAQLEKVQGELDDVRAIARAKRLLMQELSMAEPDAHRYLQQFAMKAGQRLPDAARALLNRFG